MSSGIFITPEPDEADLVVIEEIERLRRDLSNYVRHKPRRWAGHLRRMSLARAIRGSNWIEGYRASLDDVLDTIEGEEPIDATQETRLALAGYRDAMTYVLQLSETDTQVDESLLRSLHFMMTKHDLSARPGLYRPGPVWVEDENEDRVYEAPDVEFVEPLMVQRPLGENLWQNASDDRQGFSPRSSWSTCRRNRQGLCRRRRCLAGSPDHCG